MKNKLRLLSCPFCGGVPEAEPWHGGAPTKVMIQCSGRWAGGAGYEDVEPCEAAPCVTGETLEEAQTNWNQRFLSDGRYHVVEVKQETSP